MSRPVDVFENNTIPDLSKTTSEAYFSSKSFDPNYLQLMEYGVCEEYTDYLAAAKNGGKNINTSLTAFNRYYKVFPGDETSGILSYIFIVRPDLNMEYCIDNDQYYRNLWMQYPDIILSLTQGFGEACGGGVLTNDKLPNHQFISWLTPRVTSYGVGDVTLTTYDYEQPYTNYRTIYAGNMNDSLSGASVSVSFREHRKLLVTRLFDAWIRYINGISIGRYKPKNEYCISRITDGATILDYCTSIYQIGVLPEGREIVYFHKTTGLFPTNSPVGEFEYSEGPNTNNKCNITFNGGFPETFEPQLLADFNYNAGLKENDSVEAELNYNVPIVGVPFITCNPQTGKYYLRWNTLN